MSTLQTNYANFYAFLTAKVVAAYILYDLPYYTVCLRSTSVHRADIRHVPGVWPNGAANFGILYLVLLIFYI